MFVIKGCTFGLIALTCQFFVIEGLQLKHHGKFPMPQAVMKEHMNVWPRALQAWDELSRNSLSEVCFRINVL